MHRKSQSAWVRPGGIKPSFFCDSYLPSQQLDARELRELQVFESLRQQKESQVPPRSSVLFEAPASIIPKRTKQKLATKNADAQT